MIARGSVPDPAGRTTHQVDELTLLAMLLWGEARGESYEGKIAVAWVVRNRVAVSSTRRFGSGWRGVMLRPRQFSCFLESDPNAHKLRMPLRYESALVWDECYRAAAAVFFDLVPDPVAGADHYHTTGVQPAWSRGVQPVATVGNHRFFRLG